MSLTDNLQLQLFDTKRYIEGSFSQLCQELGIKKGPCWADRFGAALRRWSNKVVRHSIPTLSLFSGAGGLDIAFHDAGFMINKMVEIDGNKVTARLIKF